MTEPKANDQPLTDFKADDFPSIEQIYAMLIKAQQTGCWRVAIIYDPIKYYPAWSVIETLKPDIVADSKQIESFQISDLK